jgi:hypothetical protein
MAKQLLDHKDIAASLQVVVVNEWRDVLLCGLVDACCD